MLGERSYPSLREVDVPVDVVNCSNRRPRQRTHRSGRVAIGAKTLWFQPRTHTDEAVSSREAGLTVVAKRCMGATMAWLGLGPGPHLPSVA